LRILEAGILAFTEEQLEEFDKEYETIKSTLDMEPYVIKTFSGYRFPEDLLGEFELEVSNIEKSKVLKIFARKNKNITTD